MKVVYNGSGVKSADITGAPAGSNPGGSGTSNNSNNIKFPPPMTVVDDGTVYNPAGHAPPGLNRGTKPVKPDNPNNLNPPANPGTEDPSDAKANKGEHIYTYDANDRVITGTIAGKPTAYTYDTMGNLVKETFVHNNKTDIFKYNNLNQLVERTTSTNDKFVFEYDQRGNRTGELSWNPNNMKKISGYDYNLENQLVEGFNRKDDYSAYSYNALGIRVNNKQTAHSGQVYDRDYVTDYTTVWGIAPTVQNYVMPGDVATPSSGWDDGSRTNGLDIQDMLAHVNNGFNTLRENGTYIFVYDYHQNILAVNGKDSAPIDAENAKYELKKPIIHDFINHFLGRTVDNGHIIGIGDNKHRPSDVDNMGNSDILIVSPGYYTQKHVYTDRGQRMAQKTDTAAQTGGNGGNIRLLYVHEDIMGNTRYHTKDNGQSYAELEYDVWGNPTSPNMLLNNDNGVFITAIFTGHIYDTVLDIYFAEARFLDAKNRQWLSSDPMKDGLNWYQYVGSNPATYTDPWGLWKSDVHYSYTYIWAKRLGIGDEQAKIIAKASDGVDTTLETMPYIGDVSWHVNANKPGEIDSRIAHAEQKLYAAIVAFAWAEKNYNDAISKLKQSNLDAISYFNQLACIEKNMLVIQKMRLNF